MGGQCSRLVSKYLVLSWCFSIFFPAARTTISRNPHASASKIKSLDYKQQALQKEADNGKLILQNQLQNAFQQYNQNLSQYNYYKSTALPNADIIISTAKVGFKSGDIGYIEYLQALQTATDVQLSYLQSVNQINQSIVNINFLINK